MPDDEWSWDLPKRAQSPADATGPRADSTPRPRRATSRPAEDSEPPEDFQPAAGARQEAAPQQDAPQRDAPQRATAARQAPEEQAPQEYSRVVLLTIAGAILPGLGLIAAGRRRAGAVVLTVFVLLIVGIGVWALADTDSLLSAAVSPRFLGFLAIGLVVAGLLWIGVVIATHLSLTGRPLRRAQRIGGSVLVALLSFAVAAPMAVAARYSVDQASLVQTVFQGQHKSNSATRPTAQPTSRSNPWAGTPRVNILLLGGDAGVDRTGNRTDTVIVASIDTTTGDTTLISLPRNTGRMPFPDDSPLHKYYPNGFTDGNGDDAEYFLNAMYDNVPNKVPHDILGKTDNLGADVMKISVGDAIGLKIDYYMLIDLSGFRQLVDALGGITVNINTYVAIGGNTDLHIPPKTYLKPGPHQHLDGAKALWFARGRYGADDFQRMDRQRCVINAIIDQANPGNLLTRYEAIAKAGKKIVRTDIPQESLSAFVDLSLRAKKGNVRSLVFKNAQNGFSSPDPDFDLMREQVAKALDETKEKPKISSDKKSSDSSSSSSKPSSTGSASSDGSGDDKAQSESTKDACAWQPEVAAQAQPPR